jgi:hypothetical protein
MMTATPDNMAPPAEAGQPPARFQPGDSVKHTKTGEVGTVLSCKANSVWVATPGKAQLPDGGERRMWWLDEVEEAS